MPNYSHFCRYSVSNNRVARASKLFLVLSLFLSLSLSLSLSFSVALRLSISGVILLSRLHAAKWSDLASYEVVIRRAVHVDQTGSSRDMLGIPFILRIAFFALHRTRDASWTWPVI
jgi:hypothetical protein